MDQASTDRPDAASGEVGMSQRHSERDSLFLSAQLEIGGAVHQVRVRNLSEGGMMADYPHPIAIGTAVQIDLRGIGRVGGKVAWTSDGRMGVAFDSGIDPKLARKPVGGGAHTPFYAKAIVTTRTLR